MPPGMTLEQMLRVMGGSGPVTEPGSAALPEVFAEPDLPPSGESAELFIPESAPVKPSRKRAHTPAGTFKADDPATPQNEAWEPAAES